MLITEPLALAQITRGAFTQYKETFLLVGGEECFNKDWDTVLEYDFEGERWVEWTLRLPEPVRMAAVTVMSSDELPCPA